ncbi:integral membrane protein [soil metagenome]
MTPPIEAADRVAAESWFLAHGLPAVLRPGALVRRIWPRSAPALAGFAVLMANSVLVVLVSGKHTIDIDGTPTRSEWFVLGLLLLVVPIAGWVGWWVSGLSQRRRSVASGVSVVVSYAGAIFGGVTAKDSVNLLMDTVVIAAIFVCTATGIGSILGWSARVTAANLASVGSLFVRALPVVLLTVLVFFNSYVWLMAALVSRARLWVALLFLFAIAAVFLVSSTLDRVNPILDPNAKKAEDAQSLTGTPFESMPDRPRRVPLSRTERVNVAFVLGLSQIAQVLMVAAVTSSIFFVLGLILLSPELLAAWTRNGSSDGDFLGMTFPVPQSLIQTTMFLGALTFMYISARAVGDADQRTRFLDPLVEDLRLTMVARDRYRTYTAAR